MLLATVEIKHIVVASPSDVQAERNALPAVVDEINHGLASDHGLRLDLARWETYAHPGFHPEWPRGLIDDILRIEDCDILIGIFWKRFGTPVPDAKSGTEHEFQRAHEAWKQTGRPQIMVYFNQRGYAPRSREETDLTHFIRQHIFRAGEKQTPLVSTTPAQSRDGPALTRQPFAPEMILIPAGEFLMGSDPQQDADAHASEQPQHRLSLPDDYLAKTPVTHAQYNAFILATGGEAPEDWE